MWPYCVKIREPSPETGEEPQQRGGRGPAQLLATCLLGPRCPLCQLQAGAAATLPSSGGPSSGRAAPSPAGAQLPPASCGLARSLPQLAGPESQSLCYSQMSSFHWPNNWLLYFLKLTTETSNLGRVQEKTGMY